MEEKDTHAALNHLASWNSPADDLVSLRVTVGYIMSSEQIDMHKRLARRVSLILLYSSGIKHTYSMKDTKTRCPAKCR